MFRSRRPQPSELAPDASFGVYVEYYAFQRGLSQNKLAVCSRIPQPKLSKMISKENMDVPVQDLVALCLALGLNREESYDLLSRKERTFSPAKKQDLEYLKLIDRYSKKKIDYSLPKEQLEHILDEANEYLRSKKYDVFV